MSRLNKITFDESDYCVKSVLLLLTSGVAATRFSKGKCSLGTPTVNFEYVIPFGVSSSLAAEKYLCNPTEDDESLWRQRSPSDRTLPGLMEARRIMNFYYNVGMLDKSPEQISTY